MDKRNFDVKYLVVFVVIIVFLFFGTKKDKFVDVFNDNSLDILSSYENAYLESDIKSYASKNGIKVNFTYMGDLDIVDEINKNSKSYDGVWISNSMWLYMLDNNYVISESKSISISPVVVGIRKKKAKELDIIDKDITNNDIVKLISDKQIKYVMSSVTKTNTGATSYFGFLNALAGNPEVLTIDMLNDSSLISKLTDIFSGVLRVSGDEGYLEEMFLNSNDYEAVIADEASLININKNLRKKKRDELYLLYPVDGVAVNDSTFAFIDNDKGKKDNFLKIQNYLLSGDGQRMLDASGRRTWYGGVNKDSNNNVFNKDWGIDTSKYLNVTKFPSKSVMTEAINLYIEKIRKPSHVVFCLDYSGSMYGDGIRELRNAMSYILDYESSKKDKLQFSDTDKITVVTFSSKVSNVWNTDSGHDTLELRKNVNNFHTGGGTALYDAINKGIDILSSEDDDYTKTIIAMTDGYVNVGDFSDFKKFYKMKKSDVAVYSIMFGDASSSQLNDIANLTNAKVFDGRTNLLKAFKEVRSYN